MEPGKVLQYFRYLVVDNRINSINLACPFYAHALVVWLQYSVHAWDCNE